MNPNDTRPRLILQSIARRVMLEKGLSPDFSPAALAERDKLSGPAQRTNPVTRDLTKLLWCSIDNDDSRDLDQLSAAEAGADGSVKLLVAIADVDALVPKGCALDQHAQQNTTSVYTAAEIFPMLPEKLSTDLTSLNQDADRLAVVFEMVFAADGSLQSSGIYLAQVRNRAKLAYNSVAAWFEGTGPMPPGIGKVNGLAESLKIQDGVAQKLKALRHAQGALDFETIQTRAVFSGDEIHGLEVDARNRAKDLIEEFMVAANGVSARFLESKKFPTLQRVVRTPKRWEQIVELAAEHKHPLPAEPDSKALEQFLTAEREADPLRFPDLSLSVIKLMGPGEYVVDGPGQDVSGHFGLAVKDYSHSTAPNRRYPDVITQRLLKSALAGGPPPYPDDELQSLAKHCTEAEDAAKKVERQVRKSAAALLLSSRIGQQFDAIVTGVADKGTWVRVLNPPIEGRLVSGFAGLKFGNRLRVQLTHTDVQRGFIDFRRVD